jgi:hypothetical protein
VGASYCRATMDFNILPYKEVHLSAAYLVIILTIENINGSKKMLLYRFTTLYNKIK